MDCGSTAEVLQGEGKTGGLWGCNEEPRTLLRQNVAVKLIGWMG